MKSLLPLPLLRMSQISVFVSGAFGFPARSVVKELNRLQCDTRIGVFPGQMPLDLVRGGAKLVRVDPSQQDTIEEALEGIGAAFLWRTEDEPEDFLNSYIDASIKNGVKRLVILSAYHANPDSGKTIEEDISSKPSIPPHTFLRVPMFIHHFELYIDSIIKDKSLPLPIGTKGSFGPLDDRDFATVVANILLTPETDNVHNNQVYTLTGPNLYTGPQLAEKLGNLMKDRVEFHGTSINEAEVFLTNVIAPNSDSLIKKHLELYRAIRDGEISVVTDDMKKLLGQEPKDLDVYFSEVIVRQSLPPYMRQFKGL